MGVLYRSWQISEPQGVRAYLLPYCRSLDTYLLWMAWEDHKVNPEQDQSVATHVTGGFGCYPSTYMLYFGAGDVVSAGTAFLLDVVGCCAAAGVNSYGPTSVCTGLPARNLPLVFLCPPPLRAELGESRPKMMGTVGYMPLECMLESVPIDSTQDVWALGVMTLIICAAPAKVQTNMLNHAVRTYTTVGERSFFLLMRQSFTFELTYRVYCRKTFSQNVKTRSPGISDGDARPLPWVRQYPVLVQCGTYRACGVMEYIYIYCI